MPDEPNYRREFARSPHHLWLAILTLGFGILSAEFLGLILGITGYTLGWIYLPDMPFFKKWFRRRQETEERKKALEEMVAFVRRRDGQLATLSPGRRARYAELVEVCRDIEKVTTDSSEAGAGETRVRKLEELMWTYLRLLGMEESLELFLESERKEDLPRLVEEAEEEAARLSGEVEALKSEGSTAAMETRQRLLSSRQDRLDVLRKRLERVNQARENLALVVSEQDRLQQQIKLIRADSVAMRNAEALTARIDASVQQLDQTNRWLSQMAEFKDVVGDMPPPDVRIGFGAAESQVERAKRGKVKERA